MSNRPIPVPHPIDIHVGRIVRQRRKALGVSQKALAGRLGVTFQQLQKYEQGDNRIGASRLMQLALALKMPVGRFFEGLDSPVVLPEATAEKQARLFLKTAEGQELARTFPKIARPAMRRRILELVKSLNDG